MKNDSVVDIKARNAEVIDIKSSMEKPSLETVVYTDPNVLYGGMPIGLLLTLTYPENAGTILVVRD